MFEEENLKKSNKIKIKSLKLQKLTDSKKDHILSGLIIIWL